jgi:hypothetical protein
MRHAVTLGTSHCDAGALGRRVVLGLAEGSPSTTQELPSHQKSARQAGFDPGGCRIRG